MILNLLTFNHMGNAQDFGDLTTGFINKDLLFQLRQEQ